MGGCTSKTNTDIEEGISSIPFLDSFREMVNTLQKERTPQETQEIVLTFVDNELRERFLDECVKDVKAVASNGIMEESKLPACISTLLDQKVLSVSKTKEGLVNCFIFLQNIDLSSKLISYPCEDAEKHFICRQFNDNKSNMAFLYDISTKIAHGTNLEEYNEKYEENGYDLQVSSVEKVLLTYIPCLLENNEFAGNWKSLNIPMIPPNEVVMEGLVEVEEENGVDAEEKPIEKKKEELVPPPIVVEEKKEEEPAPIEEDKKEE